MDTEDTVSTRRLHPRWQDRTASGAASDTEMEAVVRVRDRSDSISDQEPATRRPRYEGSQSSTELIGPLSSDDGGRDGRAEMDHGGSAQTFCPLRSEHG